MERLNARNSEAFTLLHGAGHTFGKRLTQVRTTYFGGCTMELDAHIISFVVDPARILG